MKINYSIVILLILFISCSAVYAEGNDSDIYQDTPQSGSFQTLSLEIQGTPETGTLNLDGNYTLNSDSQGEENTFKEGININKSITINGNNHIIDAQNLARIFNINSDVILKNLILTNGYHTGSDNGGGAINVNTGSLILENCIILNNNAYSTSSTKGTAVSNGGGAICVNGNTYVSINNCSFINNTLRGSCNVGGGAIMFKSNSNFTVNNSVFINNKVISGMSTFGGAITEREIKSGKITNCNFINNTAGMGKSISVHKAILTGNQFINSGIDYTFSSSGSCTYNAFINGGISFSNSPSCSATIKNNWFGYNPSSKNSNIVADLINNGGTIYVTLTKDGYGNNLSNTGILYPRNVEFNGDLKYDTLITNDSIAINELNKTLKEGYLYSVNVKVDNQILDLYFKYIEQNNVNISATPTNETYTHVNDGEFKIKGCYKQYHSFYEVINDALLMDDDVTIYMGEGVYTQKWSDTYYNYEHVNYGFNFTSNDKTITIIGAGSDKSIFKGESYGFKINGNSSFRFVNLTFEDFKNDLFTFNLTNTNVYFTNCIFRNISTKFGIYLTGENATVFIDGCYFDAVNTYPFWNNANNSYFIIDSTIFRNTNYNYAFSEIYKVHDYNKHISTIYHNFNDYYIFNHNLLLDRTYEGFDCTPQIYLSKENIGLGDSVDIIADFNYFTNSSGTYKFNSCFINGFEVSINTSQEVKKVKVENGVACLKYTPKEAGTQTVTVKYDKTNTELTLNITSRQTPTFAVEGSENIAVTLPADATGNVAFIVNGKKTEKNVIDGTTSINLAPLSDIKYTVDVIYSGDSKYTPANKTLVFSPERNVTYLTIECNDTLIYDDTVIDVVTNAEGNIRLIVDNIEYTNVTTNNVAKFIIKNLTFGSHDIMAIYDGNFNYLPENSTAKINVIKHKPTLTTYVKTVPSGEDVIMNITLNDDITSEVYIFMNNKVYRTNVENGTGYLNFTRLHGGEYEYRLHFNVNDKYYSTDDYEPFTVIKLSTIYVDCENGSDENMGTSKSDALKTIKCALECINYNGTIYLCGGVYNGLDNTKLTITQPVNIIGLEDAIIDGEAKNYFFKINEGLTLNIDHVNFKNTYSTGFENALTSNLTIKNSRFDGGRGIVILNRGNLYLNNTTFNSISSASAKGLIVSNYGNADIYNTTFKNSRTYDSNRIYGLIYNEGKMSVEKCIFDNTTPERKYGAEGSFNIYNENDLTAKHNIFINSAYELYAEPGTTFPYIYAYDNGGSEFMTLNYFDANRNPDEKYTNFDIHEYFIMDLDSDYHILQIGEKTNITATLKLNNGKYYSDYELLPDIFIEFNVNGKNITKKIIDGKASVEFNESDVKGRYIVTAKLGDCIKIAEIDVGKNRLQMDVKADEINYDDNAIFYMNVTGNLTQKPTGEISVIIDGEKYTAILKNSAAKCIIPGLLPKTYDLIIRYEGDEYYTKSIYHVNYTVHKKPTYMSISIPEISYGETGIITVSLTPTTFSNQAYMYITDENNKTTKKTVYVRDGTQLKLKNYAGGEYKVTIELWNNSKFESTSASAIFKVNKFATNLTVNATDINGGETEILNITLTPKGEVAGEAILKINNYTQTIFLKNGFNTVEIENLSGGIYDVSVTFIGDKKYAQSSATAKFAVKMEQTNITARIENSILYINTTPNSTGKVLVYINDDIFEVNLTDCRAILPINFTKAENYIFIYYLGDRYYNYTTTGLIYEYEELVNLTGYDETFYNTENQTYYVTLTDEEGYGIANRTIALKINNEVFEYITGTDGSITVQLNLTVGKYEITAQYRNKTAKNTITILEDAFITGNDTQAYTNVDFTYAVELNDHNGKAITNEEITFKINGKTYTNRTNDKGIAIITLNLKEGNYTITSSYKNITKTARIIIVDDSHLVGNDVKAYSGTNFTYNVKLTDHDNKGISDAEIAFKINEKTYTNKTDVNGQTSLTFNLETGNYTIITRYKNRTITNNFEIIEDYILAGNDIKIYADTDFTYKVKLTDHNAKAMQNAEITFEINGKTYTNKTDVNGQAKINLNLKTGNYTITTKYRNTTTTNTLIIIEDYILNGNDVKALADDDFKYKVNLTDHNGKAIKNAEITFEIDGKTYTNKTNNQGLATITLNLKEGNYTITATYKNISAANELEIIENHILTGQNVKAYENTDFTYTVTLTRTDGTPIADKEITFIINNRRYTNITNKEGKASKTLNLPERNYTITATYKNTTITNNLTIIEEYHLNANNIKTYSEKDFTYKVNLTDHNKNPVKNVEITFEINEKQYTNKTDNNGQATLNLNLPKGNYTITATYKNISTTNKLEIIETFQITGTNIKSYENFDFEYIITLKNHNNKTIQNQKITFKIDGKTYTNTTNQNGQTKITLNLKKGNYTITATYKDISTTNKIEIIAYALEQIESQDLEMYYKDGSRFAIRLTENNKPLANKTVTFTINGQPYTRKTNDNGIASIAINLNSGNHTITTRYQEEVKTNNITIKPTVEAKDIIKVYRNATQYYAKFTDSTGKVLKNAQATFNINGVFYTRTTNDEGIAKLNLNLQQGKYILTATNPVTGENAANNITILPTITENRDITKYYRNATQYTLKLIKPDGSTAGAGEKVTFNINGVYYERTTNASGIAKMNINLNPGDYIITAEYTGCRVSNNIKVLPTIKAQDLTKKYGVSNPFTATLLDGEGKPLANEKITFNINGVFYTRTTNTSGIAKLNINLQPGKYIITSSYNGLNVANTVTVQN